MDAVKAFESLANRTVMGLMLLGTLAGLVVAIWLSDRTKNEFKAYDVLMENGKASKWAVILFGSWIIHSWVLVAWTMNGAATLADLTVYGTTWVAPLIARMFIPSKPDDKGTP